MIKTHKIKYDTSKYQFRPLIKDILGEKSLENLHEVKKYERYTEPTDQATMWHKTYYDKFTGWTLGELQTLDNVEKYIDGTRVDFPLSLAGDVVSILAAKGSKIVLQDVLVVTVNDILQVPGDGYQFEGGSVLTFTEAPKIEDTIKIAFYKGSGSGDVIAKAVLETVKKGDNLTNNCQTEYV